MTDSGLCKSRETLGSMAVSVCRGGHLKRKTTTAPAGSPSSRIHINSSSYQETGPCRSFSVMGSFSLGQRRFFAPPLAVGKKKRIKYTGRWQIISWKDAKRTYSRQQLPTRYYSTSPSVSFSYGLNECNFKLCLPITLAGRHLEVCSR